MYAANHASALDILIVFGHLPVDFRIVYKRSLSLVPLVGWAIWLGGHLPIDRSHPFRARRSLDAAARRIRGGTSVVVFPEGTRSPDGSVRRFKRGSFGLAIAAGVPVVPVSLAGVKARGAARPAEPPAGDGARRASPAGARRGPGGRGRGGAGRRGEDDRRESRPA